MLNVCVEVSNVVEWECVDLDVEHICGMIQDRMTYLGLNFRRCESLVGTAAYRTRQRSDLTRL
jgi:hypothetical protein